MSAPCKPVAAAAVVSRACAGRSVSGSLAVSRSSGDLDPTTGSKLAGLSSTPDVAVIPLVGDEEFVIVRAAPPRPAGRAVPDAARRRRARSSRVTACGTASA